MVTLKASLVFSSTSLSKIPPSPKTWSGDTSFPLGARTLAYLRLNSVGGYLEASDWADPVLGGDISPLEISRSVRRYFWYSKYFFTWMCPGCQPITAGAERRGEKAASGIERRRGGGEERCWPARLDPTWDWAQLPGELRPPGCCSLRLLPSTVSQGDIYLGYSDSHLDGILDTHTSYSRLTSNCNLVNININISTVQPKN